MPDPYESIATPISADPYAAIAQPVGKTEQSSAVSRLWGNFKEGLGITNDEGAKNFFEHPINTLMNSFEGQGELATKAKQSYDKGDYVGAIQHGLHYLIPFMGPQLDQAGEQAKQGDYAGAFGRTLGVAAPMITGSPAVRGAAGEAASGVKGAVTNAVTKDVPAQTEAAHSNFMKAIPPTKTTPYTPEDLQAARPYLEDEHAGTPIQSVSDVKDAANSAIGRIENKVHEYIRANPQDQIATSPLDDVQSKLAPTNALRDGFTQSGLKELEPYNLDQPMTVVKADAMRRQFNAENSAFEAKNSVDKAQARVTDPAYAAREAASQSLRDGIYDKLDERGIPGVRELRQHEGSIIAIRDAAQNQVFRGEQGVARTGSTSIPGRMARSAIQVATTGGGIVAGHALGGTPGATAGGILGTGVGEAINRVAFPGNLTRNALIEKSFSTPITEGATLQEAPARPAIRGLLNAPATELGPSTMTNPPSESPAVDIGTRALRKGLLLGEPAPQLPAAGYTEPHGEPIGTMIGSKAQPAVQPKGWPTSTAGTEEGAVNDTALYHRAKAELGPDASLSDVLKRAQELKTGVPNAKASQPSPSAISSEPANGRPDTGTAVYEPRQPELPVASGARTNVTVPGKAHAIPAQYEVRELSDVHPWEEKISDLLDEALGGKELKPDVPLRDQTK